MSLAIAPTAEPVTIGIDISKHTLDLYVHPTGRVQQFANDPKGHTKLIAWITPSQPTRIIFEATGAYHRALELALGRAGLPAVKVNPLQARRFAEATGKRAKTDPLDAAMLARFGAALQPQIPPAKDQTIDQLGELLAARRALVKDQTAALNRAKTRTLALLKSQSQQHLQQIETQIKAIDQQCAAIRLTNDRLTNRFDILISVPSFGAPTVFALLVDIPELGSMNPKQTGSLGGLAPVTRQSGQWSGHSTIQGGRANLRHALYMPALVAIRFNPPLRAKYLALRAAGKPAKVAIVAIMRKLLILANALLRDNRKWTLEVA
jgi:transposase